MFRHLWISLKLCSSCHISHLASTSMSKTLTYDPRVYIPSISVHLREIIKRVFSCIKSITSMPIPDARRRGRPKKTWSECVKADMNMCSLGSIDPLNREARGLRVRHSSHLLPTPVPGTPTAVEK